MCVFHLLSTFLSGHYKTQNISSCKIYYIVIYIVKRDQLYKEQNTLTLFSCVDLPRIVDIEKVEATVTFLTNVFDFFTENCQVI